ncbi:MAG: type I secretion system permease/ATPase [Desulfovibrionaceae bacterium]
MNEEQDKQRQPDVGPESDSLDSGLVSVVMLAKYHGVAADVEGIRHRFAPPGNAMQPEDIIRAFKALNLKARLVERSEGSGLSELPFPVMAETREGRWVIVGGVKAGKAIYQVPGGQGISQVTEEDLQTLLSGRMVFCTKRSTLPGALRKFNITWFIPSLLKYRRLFYEVLAASFFLQLFGLLTPLFFQVVIDKVLVHHGLTTLDVLAIGLLALYVFEVTLGGLRTWLFSHTTYRVDVTLGAKLFAHLLSLPLAYFNARRVGDSVARVRELENIRRFLTGSTLTIIIDVIFTFVFLIVMFFYSVKLSVLVLALIPLYVALSMLVTPVLRRMLDEKFQRGAESQAFLVETVNGMQTLKSMAVEPQFQRKWEELLAGYVKSAFRTDNLGNIAVQATSFVNKLTTLLILWIGARSVMDGDLSIGQLIAFNMMAGRISGPILRLSKVWQDFQQAGVSLQRLGDILNNPIEPGYNPNRSSLPDLKGAVDFESIHFRYRPDGPYVLQDVTLHIRAGETVGIVGRSGSGKSTLTNLVQRLYVPEKGRVLMDGIDLTLVDTAWLRRQVGVVLQENNLFNRSVRDNIALSDPGVSMERIVRAAMLAGAHEFILELPEGYDTLVGEHGSTLSGGQRQRIAIARALLTNPRVLILDEATSALDYESEHILQKNMRAICAGRTVLVIAHRLSTVMRCDRIVVVERGQIVETGTHDQLVNTGGYYAKLWQYQSLEALADA